MFGRFKGRKFAGIVALLVIASSLMPSAVFTGCSDYDADRDRDDDKSVSDKADDDDDEDEPSESESESKEDEPSESEEESEIESESDSESESESESQPENDENAGLELPDFFENEAFGEIEGKIVDLYVDGSNSTQSYLVLDEFGNIYYCNPDYDNHGEYKVDLLAEKSTITNFDNISFGYDNEKFVIVDGDKILAMVCDAGRWDYDPEILFEAEGTILGGQEITDIKISQYTGADLFAKDADGNWIRGFEGYDSNDEDEVYIDDIGFYTNGENLADLEYKGVDVVDLIHTDFALDSDGKIHEVNTVADDDVVEGLEDYTFTRVFDNYNHMEGVQIVGLDENNNIVIGSDRGYGAKLVAPAPEGEIISLFKSYEILTIQTTTGFYTCELDYVYEETGELSEFVPCDELNAVADSVVRICDEEYVLLDDGYFYRYNCDN